MHDNVYFTDQDSSLTEIRKDLGRGLAVIPHIFCRYNIKEKSSRIESVSGPGVLLVTGNMETRDFCEKNLISNVQ